MRLLQWVSLGLISLVAADSNITHESRNILPSTFRPPQHFRNVNLVRNINLEKSYARETVNVVIENVDKAAQSEYYLPFEQGTLGKVGGLEVRDKKDPEKGGLLTEVVGIDPLRYFCPRCDYYRDLSSLTMPIAPPSSTKSHYHRPYNQKSSSRSRSAITPSPP